MFEKLEITKMAQAMSRHASARLGAVAQNVANADTPGYRAVDLPSFAEAYDSEFGGDLRATRSGHLGADSRTAEFVARVQGGSAAPNGNSVSIEQEMVKATEVRQQSDMALGIYRSASDIIRAALGRSR